MRITQSRLPNQNVTVVRHCWKAQWDFRRWYYPYRLTPYLPVSSALLKQLWNRRKRVLNKLRFLLINFIPNLAHNLPISANKGGVGYVGFLHWKPQTLLHSTFRCHSVKHFGPWKIYIEVGTDIRRKPPCILHADGIPHVRRMTFWIRMVWW